MSEPGTKKNKIEDRQAIVDRHTKERKELLKKHSKELMEFDASCVKELKTAGYDEDDNVHKRRSQVGLCCVCEKKLTVDGKPIVDDKDRSDFDSSEFDGDKCFFYDMEPLYQSVASVKCKDCEWPLVCSKKPKLHGFCRICVEEAEEAGAEALDIPQRRDPRDPGEWLPVEDRGYDLHPFHICDCEICAWCGEDNDECCVDHEDQRCSCFP